MKGPQQMSESPIWDYREALLRFEHIQGSHTGANLSQTVVQLLEEHGITNRVLSVTTDNASNNKTLVDCVKETMESIDSSDDIAIIRVPCIAHVIQLSLQSLLGTLKAIPKNEVAELECSKELLYAVRATQDRRDIVHTLGKVC
ncbi:hypothetical protein N7535_001120 [Penicillium sp. DV-2018c]|nr:hypothetical protein N7535_001120 [Penicillium sp. DV-2018c]